ncbi:ComF family protein [Gemmatimonas sp.]
MGGTYANGAWWRSLTRGALDLLLPGACALCRRAHNPDRQNGIVCGVCMAKLVPLTLPQCARCGHPRLSLAMPLAPLPIDAATNASTPEPALPPCRWCHRLDPALRAVRSVTRMDSGTGAEFVHALKYQGWERVAVPMGQRMARLSFPDDVVRERVALIPLPLGAGRLRERGYNQAELLARATAAEWNLPVWTETLRRVRDTQSQVRLTPSERASNVSQAFDVPNHRQSALRGQHVVLVDDVITTAATVNAAVQALLAGGARIVSCVTFGRAPDPGDRAAPDSDSTRN